MPFLHLPIPITNIILHYNFAITYVHFQIYANVFIKERLVGTRIYYLHNKCIYLLNKINNAILFYCGTCLKNIATQKKYLFKNSHQSGHIQL